MRKIKQYLSADMAKISLSNTPQITFEITDACNLKCTYCAYGELYSDYDIRNNQMLPEQKAIRLLDYLNDLWNSPLNTSFNENVYISFYGGEPLMNMDFIRKIVDYIENEMVCKTRIFTFSMTTNALLLNKYIDFLVQHNFNLLISLDGNKENTGYRVDRQGNETFDRIISNIDFIKEKYPSFFEKHVDFNAVLHNKNSVESIYLFFKQKYNKIPAIGNLNNTGIRPEKVDKFREMYRNSAENIFWSHLYQEIEEDMFMNAPTYHSAAIYLNRYSDYVYRDYNELLYGKSKEMETKWRTGTCVPFSKKVFVTVTGKILPCERIGHQFALGEICETGVNLDFEEIAKKYNNYYSKIDSQCASCQNKKACSQCIFNLSDIESPSPQCFGYMTKEDFNSYEQSQLHFLRRNPEAYHRIMKEVILQ